MRPQPPDPITAGAERAFLARVPGARDQPYATIAGAGHFVQGDGGPVPARVLLRRHPV